MALTTAQLTALNAAILAETDATLVAARTSGATGAVAAFYNDLFAPAYWVWRTGVTRAEIYHSTSPDATTWNWTTYKNQSVSEQGAWVQMFMGDLANFALSNLRDGVAAIFTGSAQQNAQRDHVLSVGRRGAKRGETLFATGAGTSVSPSVMGFEGNVTNADVVAARAGW